MHKLTELPPLGPGDGPPGRPLIAVMGCVVQDIVVKPNGPLTANGSTMSRIAFAPGGFGPNVAWTAALEGAAVRFVGHAGADTVGVCPHGQPAGGRDRRRRYPKGDHVLRAGARGVGRAADDGLRHLQLLPFRRRRDRGAAGWRLVAAPVREHVRRHHRRRRLESSGAGAAQRRARQPGRGQYRPRSAGGPGGVQSRIDKIAPEVLFANEEEAAALWPAGDVSAPGLVVVKHGPLPSVVYAPDGEELLNVHVPPVPEVVDTTGAGDAMAGGFLAAWASGCSLREAVEAGHRTAGAVVSQFGAQLPSDWLPSRPCGRSAR